MHLVIVWYEGEHILNKNIFELKKINYFTSKVYQVCQVWLPKLKNVYVIKGELNPPTPRLLFSKYF